MSLHCFIACIYYDKKFAMILILSAVHVSFFSALKILSVFGLVYNILNIMCLGMVVVVAVVCMCVSVYPAFWAFWICGLVSASNFENFRLLPFSNISQTLLFFFSFWGSSCISLRLFVWYCPTAVGFSGFFFSFFPPLCIYSTILPI